MRANGPRAKVTRQEIGLLGLESARSQLNSCFPVLPKRGQKVLGCGRIFALWLHIIQQIRACIAHASDRLWSLVKLDEANDVKHCLKKKKVLSTVSTQCLPVEFQAPNSFSTSSSGPCRHVLDKANMIARIAVATRVQDQCVFVTYCTMMIQCSIGFLN